MADRAVHALRVGQGWLGLGPLPRAQDVPALVDWGAKLVVSLTPAEEMATLGAAGLADALAQHGVGWLHLPIADFGVPSASVAQYWPDVSTRIAQELKRGARIFVHCRAGCGRSGMVVLRLMVEQGEIPKLALERLRETRDCAVETRAQLDWALSRDLLV